MRGPLWAGVAWVMGQVEVAITRVHLEPAPVRAELAIRATREPGDCSRVPGCLGLLREFGVGRKRDRTEPSTAVRSLNIGSPPPRKQIRCLKSHSKNASLPTAIKSVVVNLRTIEVK